MTHVVIWAGTQEEAMAFLRTTGTPRRSVILAGDHSARTLDGCVPSAVIQVGSAGKRRGHEDVEAVLMDCSGKTSLPVPWIDMRRFTSDL